MMAHDPLPDLMRLGYTRREGMFLSLAGTASGYFLARQYARFLNRKLGGLTQQLVERAQALGHVDFDEYDGWRRIYHIKSRTIYRLLGDESSQNRRFKGSQEITTKLMILDYVLERLEESGGFVCSPSEKMWLFRDSLGVAEAHLPCGPRLAQSDRGSKRDRFFPDRFPVFRTQLCTEAPETLLQFTYFDPGTASMSTFRRHLRMYKPLFEALRQFQLVYVALSTRNFSPAQRCFQHAFSMSNLASDLLPQGREHFIRFLEVQQLWDNNDSRFTHADLNTLREGEHMYARPEHQRLRAAWLAGHPSFEIELANIYGARRTECHLVCHLMQETYPVSVPRRRGKALRKSPIGTISGSDSVAV